MLYAHEYRLLKELLLFITNWCMLFKHASELQVYLLNKEGISLIHPNKIRHAYHSIEHLCACPDVSCSFSVGKKKTDK